MCNSSNRTWPAPLRAPGKSSGCKNHRAKMAAIRARGANASGWWEIKREDWERGTNERTLNGFFIVERRSAEGRKTRYWMMYLSYESALARFYESTLARFKETALARFNERLSDAR